MQQEEVDACLLSNEYAILQGKEIAHRFSERITRFLRKKERPEQIAHGRSFLVSDLSDSLTSLIKKEGMSESLIFLNKKPI